MKSLTRTAVLVVLLVVAASCGSSKSTTASTNPSAGVATTTTKAAAGTNTGGFCTRLAAETEATSALAASLGTPDQAAKVAQIKSDNAAILAAAPAEIHDAIVKVYAVSELASDALSGTASAADRAATAKATAAAASDPAFKTAIADYTAWVKANCGDQTAKILSGAS
jgi:hypothetical protein